MTNIFIIIKIFLILYGLKVAFALFYEKVKYNNRKF